MLSTGIVTPLKVAVSSRLQGNPSSTVEVLSCADGELSDEACVAAVHTDGVSFSSGVEELDDAEDDEPAPAPEAPLETAWLEASLTPELAPLFEPCVLQVPAKTIITTKRTTATAMRITMERLSTRLSGGSFGATVSSVVAVLLGTADLDSFLAERAAALVLTLAAIAPAKRFVMGSSDFAFSNCTVASAGASLGFGWLLADSQTESELFSDFALGASSIKNIVLQW